MKKTKIIAIILSALIILSGCASMEADYDSKNEYFGGGFFTEDSMAVSPESPMEMMPEVETEESVSENVSFDSGSGESSLPAGRKLIRTFSLDVETLDFDAFIPDLKAAVNSLGGYLESSNVSGNSYNYSYNRNANFVCRIPSDKIDEFISTVGTLGNVTYSYEDTTDITLQYVDTEARIKSLQTEYDRLLELLAEAENIDTIILLEQRITEVRYQLESYQSQLRTYDNLVDYCTVSLYVNEVKRITAPEQKTVWQRIGSDFSDNIYDIWVGAQNFFVWFVSNIPFFVIWAAIIFIIVFVIKRIIKKCPKCKELKAKKEAKKAKRLAEKEAEEK